MRRNFRFGGFLVFVSILVSDVFCLPVAFAGDSVSPDSSLRPTSLELGATAVLFKVSSLSLSDWQGLSLSLKRHLTASSALLLGASYNENSSDDSHDDSPVNWGGHSNQGQKSQNLSIQTQFVKYFKVRHNVHFFWAAGPGCSYYHNRGTSQGSEDSTTTRNYEGTDDRWGLSLAAGIGGEWFVRPQLSLMIEYDLGYRYSWETIRSHTTYSNASRSEPSRTQKTRSSNFSTSGPKLGLAYYF